MDEIPPGVGTGDVPKAGRKGRFLVNLISNVGNLGITSVVALWLTPYLMRNLGVAAYGLVPLSITLTSYLQLVTLSINSAVGRFLTISLERGEIEEADRVFNTSLWSIAGLALVLAIPALLACSMASAVIRIPAGYETQARWLFSCTIGMLLLTELATPFQVATFCRNRFDISNWLSLSSLAVRVAVTVALFESMAPRLWHVGVGLLLGAAAVLVGAVISWRRLLPMLTLRPRLFSRKTLRSLVGTGGWIVVNQIGTLLYTSIDLVVVNRLLGAYAGGQYAAILQWSILLRSLAGVVASTFGPTVLFHYAKGDMQGLVIYVRRAIKFMGVLMSVPIGLICGFSRPLLHLWLGSNFVPMWPLLSLMTAHLAVNLCVLPLFNVQVATGRVRIPGIVTCVMGAANLGLALLLAGPVGWGMYGVAGAGAIMLTAKNLVFTPLYGAHILKEKPAVFVLEILRTVCLAGSVAGAAWLISSVLSLSSWPKLICAIAFLAAIFCVAAYTVLLDKEERGMLMGMVSMRLAGKGRA